MVLESLIRYLPVYIHTHIYVTTKEKRGHEFEGGGRHEGEEREGGIT